MLIRGGLVPTNVHIAGTKNMGAGKPTLAQIAQSLDLSTATVSKAINDKPDVSKATKKKVEQALKDSGYRKKAQNKKAQCIEIVFQELENLWEIEVLRGLTECAAEHGLSVVVTESGDHQHPASDWASGVIARNPVGVILVFSSLTENEASLLSSKDIPFIILDPSGAPSPNSMSVRADNWTGGLLATRHLIALGHRRIGIITGPSNMLCSKARLDGYHAALEEAEIKIDDNLCREGNFQETGGLVQGESLLSMRQPPTAIFTCSDRQAMGVYEAARRLGFSIPQDLSVVGFDDIQTAAYMGPSLTTVRQPLREMASCAAEMLLKSRQGGNQTHNSVILPTSLIIRNSTQSID